MFFSGSLTGLRRTNATLRQTASRPRHPAQCRDGGLQPRRRHLLGRAEGGRVLLPLECFTPGEPSGGNTCGTGRSARGPRDARLPLLREARSGRDPEGDVGRASPDGQLLWTSSGHDLLAYRAADVSPANAAPGGPPIHAVRGCGRGAAERRDRRGVPRRAPLPRGRAGHDLPGVVGRPRHRDAPARARAAGRRRARPRGCTVIAPRRRAALAGRPARAKPTFGPTVALLHFAAGRGPAGAVVSARATRQTPGAALNVRRGPRGRPVAGAAVSVAGGRGRDEHARPRAALSPCSRARQLHRARAQGQPRGPLALPRLGSTTATGPAR